MGSLHREIVCVDVMELVMTEVLHVCVCVNRVWVDVIKVSGNTRY